MCGVAALDPALPGLSRPQWLTPDMRIVSGPARLSAGADGAGERDVLLIHAGGTDRRRLAAPAAGPEPRQGHALRRLQPPLSDELPVLANARRWWSCGEQWGGAGRDEEGGHQPGGRAIDVARFGGIARALLQERLSRRVRLAGAVPTF